MRSSFLLLLLLGALSACASIENGISGSSRPPASSGEVIGSVLWDPLAETPEGARQTAQETCTKYGLHARTTGETRNGASVTTDYVCE